MSSALRQAKRVVALDPGRLRLAVVMGVPTLGLSGFSNPGVAGLPGCAGAVRRTGLSCAPRRDRSPQRRPCLEDLTPATVAQAL